MEKGGRDGSRAVAVLRRLFSSPLMRGASALYAYDGSGCYTELVARVGAGASFVRGRYSAGGASSRRQCAHVMSGVVGLCEGSD